MVTSNRRCLLSPADVPPSQSDLAVVGVFNPGAIDLGDETLVLARIAEAPKDVSELVVGLTRWVRGGVQVDVLPASKVDPLDPRVVEVRGMIRLTFTSHLRAFRCPREGELTLDGTAGTAWLPAGELEVFGIEDPRLTLDGDRLLATYVAVSMHGAGTALACSRDGARSWERQGMIFPPENKDVTLFPGRVNGRHAALHRPNPRSWFGPPEMWVAFSSDLLTWGGHRPLDPGHVPGVIDDGERQWDIGRVGGGCPPVRTDRGWLVIYHGSAKVAGKPDAPGVYVALAMVLDPTDPARVVARGRGPIFVPETAFEREGFLGGVVFPTAILDRGDRWRILYGAADSSVGCLDLDKAELDAWLEPV